MPSSKKILAVGSLTHDLFLRPSHEDIFKKEGSEFLGFCLGEKMRINERHETFGGGGANVAVGFSRFGGFSPAILGAIGEDESAEKILRNLKKEGVSTDLILSLPDEEGSGFSAILSAKTGERTVLFCPGANAAFSDFDSAVLEHYEAVALQHLSSGADMVFQKISEHFKKFPEKFLSWNPGNESLSKGISAFSDFLPSVDCLLVNFEEAELFTGERTPESIFHAFFENGLGGSVIITDGRRGATACDGINIFRTSILTSSPRIDTLGAGDAFLTGVSAALLHKKTLAEALRYATVNAAMVVAHFGAQFGLATKEKIEQHLSEITVETTPFSL